MDPQQYLVFRKVLDTVWEGILHDECDTIACGIGTDRNGLLAAGPDLAGYQFTIRLAGFCRTKTGVWRVKYKAAGTCRKI